MNSKLNHQSVINIICYGLFAFCAFVLASCGGGGGSPGTTTVGGSNGAIQIGLTNTSGVARNTVSTGDPLTVTALVTDASGSPLKNQIVTFSTTTSLVTLSPTSGTALTNEKGIAQINMLSAGLGAGASEVTAAVTVGTAPVTAKLTFFVDSSIYSSGNGAIRIALTDANGAVKNNVAINSPLLATAIVINDNGLPVKNALVTFTLSTSLATLSPASATALTNDKGVAQINLLSAGNGSGAGEISASVSVGTSPVLAKLSFFVDPSTGNGAVRLTLTDSNGVAKSNVAVNSPLLATAVVIDDNGLPVRNAVVTFSTSTSLATLSPASGTGLTNDKGVAQVNLFSAGNGSGAGEITASVTVGTSPVTAKISFYVDPSTGNGAIRMVLTDTATGAPGNIVPHGGGLTLTATVTDDAGVPLKNKIVTFGVGGGLAVISPAAGTILTDEKGQAQISIMSAGAGSGAAEVTATVTVGTSPISQKLPFSVAPDPVDGKGIIKLVLTDASGVAKNQVSSGNPLLAIVTVTNDAGVPLKNKIVTFSVTGGVAALSPAVGTALTDDKGMAQVSLVSAGISSGAGEVTAAVSVGTAPVTAKLTFSVAAPPVLSAGNGAIRIDLTDALGLTTRNAIFVGSGLVAKATVTDDRGRPVRDKIVKFAISSGLAVTDPVDGTALTDVNGIAKLDIVSAEIGAGAAEVTASVKVGTDAVTATAAFSVGPPPVKVEENGAIRVVLTDASGAAKNVVSSGEPLLAKATVTTSYGAPLQNKLVTFTVSTSIVTISPAAGTALTDASGVAQVSIQSAGLGGAGEITASVTIGTAPVTAKAAFSVGAAQTATPVAINFVGAIPSDKSIVIKGSGGNGRTEVALLTFKVVDKTNNGVANVGVNFSLVTNPVIPPSTPPSFAGRSTYSGSTDQDGIITVALNSGTDPTTVRVVATVTGTSITALSDQVTVTTGQPVLAAFSISRELHAVEGWNIDNMKNKILVLLADRFGGAVADGTQVVFTVDSGAIVGIGGAQCLTVQGACSVDWRSQDPRGTNGLITVTATATTNGTNLTATTKFYSSGSFANVSLIFPTGKNFGNSLDFSSSCSPQSIVVEVADVNNNPMPDETLFSIANALNTSVIVSPAKRPAISVTTAGAGGTRNSLTVTPAGCDLTGAKTTSGFFDFVVTTPRGNITTYSISAGQFRTK